MHEYTHHAVFPYLSGKVPKPRVNVTCQSETVTFRCDVDGSKEQRSSISYSWHKNGIQAFKMNASNLSISVEANNSVYTCTANNPVHNNTSDPVEAACKCFSCPFIIKFIKDHKYLFLDMNLLWTECMLYTITDKR